MPHPKIPYGRLDARYAKIPYVGTLVDGDTTPDVSDGNYRQATFKTANTGLVTITDFDGGIDGQVFILAIEDSNTIIQSNGNIKLMGGNDQPTGFQYDTHTFVSIDGIWREVSRSLNS